MQVVGANGVKYLLKAIVDGLGWSEHVRRVLNAPGDVLLGPVYAYKARNLEGILLIAGYNQSGSTLIGALLNAHPDAVVVPKAKSLLYARLPGSTATRSTHRDSARADQSTLPRSGWASCDLDHP